MLDGNSALLVERGTAAPPLSKFTGVGFACLHIIRGPCLLWPNSRMGQNETWHGGRSRPGHTVLDGDSALPSPKGHSPQFSAHVCRGQTAGWIKMPLGRKVGLSLGPGHIVFAAQRQVAAAITSLCCRDHINKT